jgi:uncharacterized protein
MFVAVNFQPGGNSERLILRSVTPAAWSTGHRLGLVWWERAITLLSAAFRVVAYDQSRHGRSLRVADRLDVHIDDLATLISTSVLRRVEITGGSVRFDENAELDTSQVDDQRGRGNGGIGGRVVVGSGGVGIIGLLLYFLLSQLGSGPGSPLPNGLPGLGTGQSANDTQLSESCQHGQDANTALDCEVVAVVNSLDAYWAGAFASSGRTYRKPRITFFNGGVNSACGSASSEAGPFYCPADRESYVDLRFFQELEQRFGAKGGPFARAYVIAHEYGHHVQNLLGTSRRVQAGDSGPTSGSVRLELQAECYAGV